MAVSANIQVGGNIDGNIVVGNNNFVVNTNHGTIAYKQDAPQVRLRQFSPKPPRAPRGFVNRTEELAKLDAGAPGGPWTRRFLELIHDKPAVRAGDLCTVVGMERLFFKAYVRKLKALGLTESLEVGYRLSPRGEAVLSGFKTQLEDSGRG